MITIELTQKQLDLLTEQAHAYGRFGLLIETTDGEMASLVLNLNHRRDRRKPAALRAGETESA